MQYTVEARELSNEFTNRPAVESHSQHTIIEADDADDAISRFVERDHSQLVSFVSSKGREGIATIRKNDSVFLVRVYAN